MTDGHAERPMTISGRCWAVRGAGGEKIDDIDTDQIFHNSHLHITELAEMGSHAFGNLPGWEDLPGKAQPGDILVVGENFGSGSSRQQAVDCFISLGISIIIGESFASIYLRNGINSGLPILCCPGICDRGPDDILLVESGDRLEAHLESGIIRNVSKDREIPGASPPSRVQMEIYQAGGLFRYGRIVGSSFEGII